MTLSDSIKAGVLIQYMQDKQIEKYIYKPSTPLQKVIDDLYRKKIDICLVCKHGKILDGVITLGDIKKSITDGFDPSASIVEVMNTDFFSASDTMSEHDLKQLDNKAGRDIRRIPILNSKNEVVAVSSVTTSDNTQHKTVLVTGGAGYVGSIVCRKLLEKKYKVIILDKLLFGREPINEILDHENVKLIHGEIGNLNHLIEGIKDADYVIHLAGIVGDPASSLDPLNTMESNFFSTQALIELCKYYQVSRFVFASSCSVYGASDDILTEESSLNPVSLYARTKIRAEEELLKASNEFFHPVILRFGTLYGLSPRMRFDLVANIMSAHGFFKKNVTVMGGDQWRPLLHVSDAAEACVSVLESPLSVVDAQIFNVGSDHQNFKISDIAHAVKKHIPDSTIVENNDDMDKRNYRVSFKKITNAVSFQTNTDLNTGVGEMIAEMNNGHFSDYEKPQYSNFLSLRESTNIE